MARANVGTLSVIVGANIRALNRGLARAARSIGNFARAVGRTARRMAMFGAAATAAAAAIGGVMVRGQLRAIDETAKLADQVGATTENLTAMNQQAELSGSSSQALASSLQRMNRRIGLAAQGSGEAADALERMGFDAQAMTNLGADEQFAMIAERIASIEDAGEQAALAFRVFGRQGQELLPMLRQGREGMEQMRAEMEARGELFSREEAQLVEQANDAITRLRTSVTAVAQRLTVALAPAIERVAAFLTNVAREQSELWSTTFGGIVEIGRAAIERVGAAFRWWWENTVEGFAIVEFAIRNWRDVLTLAFNAASLQVVRFGNQVHHFFTSVIPSVLSWFGDNWREIFVDLFAFTSNVFHNLAQNIQNVMTQVWRFISSAGTAELEFAWKPLTEGFRTTVRELPEIAEREMGGLEAELSRNVQEMGRRMGGELDEFVEQRRQSVERLVRGFGDLFDAPDGADAFDRTALRDMGMELGQGFNESAQVGDDALDLIRAGTAEAQAMAQRDLRRQHHRDNTEKQHLGETKKSNKLLSEISKKMDTPALAAAELTP